MKRISLSLFYSIKNISNSNSVKILLENFFSKNLTSCTLDECLTSKDDIIEEIICKVTDINENEMKVFNIGNGIGEVLLIKQKGIINALGTKCTHYGAPLQNSILGDGRIRCQWHGACFNITTGDIENFPGLDSLPCYKVNITEKYEVKIYAKRSLLQTNKRIKSMEKHNGNSNHFVIIGGGPSAETCAETLRQDGFSGKITIITKENFYPYDRVKYSKQLNFNIESAEFRKEDFYRDGNINVIKGSKAVQLDSKNKIVKLENNDEIAYDKLYIATGMDANIPSTIEGTHLKNVFTLRSYQDACNLNSQLYCNNKVVILGSSFISMECASYCYNKIKELTIIARDALPFKNILGEKISNAILNELQKKNIKFLPNCGIKRIFGENKKEMVSHIELNNSTIIPTDLVIIATGGLPSTNFLNNSGIILRYDGSIEVNEYLECNLKDIFVGGDIAYAPVWCNNNNKATIGHIGLAHYHGKIAALNMLGKKVKLHTVPYFWTVLFGKTIRYAGHGEFNDIFYIGNVDEFKFVAYYLKDDEIVAVSSCGMDPVVSAFAELLSQNKKLYKKDIDPFFWTSRLLFN